jgi:spermidine synthase
MRVEYTTELFNIVFEQNQKGFWTLKFGKALQWNSADEYRYHQTLFGLPVLVHPKPERILVLGGGDGLGVRELLKFPEIEEITLVDISEEMLFLARKHPVLRRLNQDSLNNEKVKVIIEDAFNFVKKAKKENLKWDIVIADYPDPDFQPNQVNRLFTVEHYSDIAEILKDDGIFSAQATSVIISPNVFRKICLNLAEVFNTVVPFRIPIFSYGDIGITLAFNSGNLVFKRPTPNGYFFTQQSINEFVFYHNDELPTLDDQTILSLPIYQLAVYDIYELPYDRILRQYEINQEN